MKDKTGRSNASCRVVRHPIEIIGETYLRQSAWWINPVADHNAREAVSTRAEGTSDSGRSIGKSFSCFCCISGGDKSRLVGKDKAPQQRVPAPVAFGINDRLCFCETLSAHVGGQ